MKNRGQLTARRKPNPSHAVAQVPAGSFDYAASVGRVARRIRDELGLTLASVAQQAGGC